MTQDKVAVVTGAGTGIGKATRTRVLKDGWRVALVGRRREPLEETVKSAGVGDDRAIAISADVAIRNR